MQRILLPVFALVLGAAAIPRPLAAEEPWAKLGAWSNVTVYESEDPHASGFQLELWEHGGDIVGVLMLYVGPVADPPIGELREVAFDPKTGELSFKADMSIGNIRGAEPGSWIPSHDLYTFSGRIEKDKLKGDLIQRVMNTDPPATNHQQVELPPLRDEEMAVKADSFEAWRAWLDEALEARGPKW